MSRRLTAFPGIMKIIRNTGDYTVRSIDLILMRTICSFLAILGLSVLSTQALIGVTQADLDKFALDNLASSVAFVTFLISISTFLALFLVLKLYRTIVISQFQSMMFAGALRVDSVMCMVIDSNLNILYLDENAQAILCSDPNCDYRRFAFNLEQLFEEGKIDTYNREQFLQSVQHRHRFSVQHTLVFKHKELKEVVTKLEPLNRPKKCFLIKSYAIK